MKHWILGAALFVATGVAQAENYRIVQSPSQKLDVWIDNIKGNTAQSWCANEVALRIVANGNKNVKILDNFLPRVGALMEHQCSRLQLIRRRKALTAPRWLSPSAASGTSAGIPPSSAFSIRSGNSVTSCAVV